MLTQRTLSWLGATFLLGVMLSLSACVIHSDEVCYEECTTDLYCDPWGCWEEEVCECVYYEDHDYGPECYDSRDCRADERCVGGWCEPIADAPRGTAGFCQACDQAEDCIEDGALCVEFESGERACARACASDHECPAGYECLDISDRPEHANQCIPAPDAEGHRTCTASPDGSCQGDRDCARGLSCVDGQCVEATPGCQLASDCSADESCIDGTCVANPAPECREDRDCAEGLICRDATCVDPCADPSFQCDADCAADADCADGQACVDGRCVEPTTPCTADSECEGAICLDGVCSAPECSTGADCGEDGTFLCVGGHCRAACAADADCAEGLRCHAPGFCAP